MNFNQKKKIFDTLENLGISIDENAKENILLSFEEYMNKECENEIKLLREAVRIKKKISKNKKLSQIEQSFINYLLLNYS